MAEGEEEGVRRNGKGVVLEGGRGVLREMKRKWGGE